MPRINCVRLLHDIHYCSSLIAILKSLSGLLNQRQSNSAALITITVAPTSCVRPALTFAVHVAHYSNIDT